MRSAPSPSAPAPAPTAPSASSSPSPEPVASGPQVTLAYAGPGVGLVGVGTAAVTPGPSHLFLTEDFVHWREVTPSQAATDPGHPWFEDGFFLDATRGWVTTFNPANIDVVIYRTVDGGHHWAQLATTDHTMNAGAITRLQFLSASMGYMDTEQPSGPGAQLSVTVDGGAHWTVRAEAHSLPVADVRFLDPTHAIATNPSWWCADGPVAGVSWSADGGRSWATSVLPPEGAAAGIATCLGAPSMASARRVLLPITTITDAGSRASILISDDAGATWRRAGTLATSFTPVHSDLHGGPGAPTGAVAPDRSWWVAGMLPPGSLSVATSADLGAHWRTAAARGLTGQPLRLIARSARAAWALVLDGANTRLFASSDGGDTWAPVAPAQAG